MKHIFMLVYDFRVTKRVKPSLLIAIKIEFIGQKKVNSLVKHKVVFPLLVCFTFENFFFEFILYIPQLGKSLT